MKNKFLYFFIPLIFTFLGCGQITYDCKNDILIIKDSAHSYLRTIENRSDQAITVEIDQVKFVNSEITEIKRFNQKEDSRFSIPKESGESEFILESKQINSDFNYLLYYFDCKEYISANRFETLSALITVTFEDGSQYKIAGWNREYYSEDGIDKYGLTYTEAIDSFSYEADNLDNSNLYNLKLIVNSSKDIVVEVDQNETF